MQSQEAATTSDSAGGASSAGHEATLHAKLDVLADRVARGELVGLIVFDASRLAEFEHEYGADRFESVVGRLHADLAASKGSAIRQQDLVCRNAPGGEAVLLFLARPRNARRRLRLADLEAVVQRARHHSLNTDADAPAIADAIGRIRIGAAIIGKSDQTDPRRSIYRTIRRARAAGDEPPLRPPSEPADAPIHAVVAERQLQTRFQPIVDLAHREPLGWEALTRPQPDATRQLERSLFAAADHAGIGAQLDAACRDLALRRRPALDDGEQLFINCLGSAFVDPAGGLEDFVDKWTDCGLAPSKLVFELNENVTQRQLDAMLPTVQSLRERGVRFALDDMGTGKTNLRVLVELEPDYIKMDKTLTRGIAEDVRRQALTSYMVDLARRSDARLVAEGIETAADLETVAELGVHCAQGYHLGRPETSDRIGRLEETPS